MAAQPQNEYDRIEHNLTLHPPKDEAVTNAMDAIRQGAKNYAHLIDANVPASRELSQALTAVEDACQYAIAGIARNQGEFE